MPNSLYSVLPDADLLVRLTVEELAEILLSSLRSYKIGDQTSIVAHDGAFNQHNYFNDQRHGGVGGYPRERLNVVLTCVMEAWAWLISEGLLVRSVGSGGSESYFLSRRALAISTKEDFAAYRKGKLLPTHELHPLIASRVYPAFLRGEYDTAVFQAFREVEIAVRQAANRSDTDVGVTLMREAFKPRVGPLADKRVSVPEQEAMANLFAGAIGLYKNPTSHRYVPTGVQDAVEVIQMASQLLRIVDRRKAVV